MSASEKQFSFSQVTILKEETLGRGSYGSVCKAKCDTLACAAKIMHPLLFDFGDPGVDTMIKRFKQECEILSGINHPNVVQYLGTFTDPDTRLPILLMELMDQSLTRYLEGQKEPLPVHMQVTFGTDIALALAFLHSNNIQHRDLSSNNILLLGDRRAKVTDFGMSRLEKVNSRMTPATMCCPGTMDYMSPEALKENQPHYTDKLDVFSFGVLLIQIMTREFPKPSERFTTFQIPDPKNKKRTIEVQTLVKEAERRQNHIGMVDKDNPLLVQALACIRDEHEKRPSAGQLCEGLLAMRSTDVYKLSAEAGNFKERYDKLRGDFNQQEVALRKANTDIEDLRNQSERDEEVFKKLLDDKDYVIQEKDCIIKAQEEKLAPTNELTLSWKRVGNAPTRFKGRCHTAVVGGKAYFHELGTKDIYEYDAKDQRWEKLPDAPVQRGFTLVAVHDLFLTTVGGYSNSDGKLHTYITRDKKWVERFPPTGCMYVEAFAASTRERVIVIGKRVHRGNTSPQDSMTGHVLDLQSLEWTEFKVTQFSPTVYLSAFMFVSGDTLYHAGGCDLLGPTDAFHSCPVSDVTEPTAWKKLCDLPRSHQMPVAFKGYILALRGGGGTRGDDTLEGDTADTDHTQQAGHDNTDATTSNAQTSATVYRHQVDTDTWQECGEMGEALSNCKVAVLGEEMVVVGEDASTDDTFVTFIATVP